MTSLPKSKKTARTAAAVPVARTGQARDAGRKPSLPVGKGALNARSSGARPLAAKQDAAVYRVNARFDADVQGKLDYLARERNQSTSEVLREAVNFYYESQQAQRARKRGFIESLIGSAEGPLPADLSENYKHHVAAAIAKKHGHR